jgi:hypothetical protein
MIMRFVVGVLACMGVGGLALADPATPEPAPTAAAPSTPTTPSTPTSAAATPAPAPAAPAAPAAAPAVPAGPTAAPASHPAPPTSDFEEKRLLSEGYRIEMRNGERVFCHREEVLGSRVEGRKVCNTKQQLELTESQSKHNLERTQQQWQTPPVR